MFVVIYNAADCVIICLVRVCVMRVVDACLKMMAECQPV